MNYFEDNKRLLENPCVQSLGSYYEMCQVIAKYHKHRDKNSRIYNR